MLRAHAGEPRLDVGDDGVGGPAPAERPAGQPGLLLPRKPVVGMIARLGDGRRDGREQVEVASRHAGVDAEDQVGPQRRDALEVELLGPDQRRLLAVERVLRPRPAGDVDPRLELPGADRPHAEREGEVLVVEADGDDALRVGGHLGRAELVLDRDGPGRLAGRAAVLAAAAGEGEEERGDERGDEVVREP